MKLLKNQCLLFLFYLLVVFSACNKIDKVVTPPTTPPTTTGNTDVDALVAMNVPESFNYSTDKDVTVDITILAPDNTPVDNIPVRILNLPDDLGGEVLYTCITNAAGKISGSFKLPASMENIVLDPRYLGVMRNATVKIVNNNITCSIGGTDGYTGNVVPNSVLGGRAANLNNIQGRPIAPLSDYEYMGSYDGEGKPDYLESTNDVISSSFVAKVNASLPEHQDVKVHHPSYLLANTETNINITTSSDITFTFLSEGGSKKNSFAYFTFPTNNPPQTKTQVGLHRIVFPNSSLRYSGGALVSGNKVSIGRVTAGTSIGFAVIADGWNGSVVNTNKPIYYSIDNLNQESNTSRKRHSVLVWDSSLSLYIVGFEDDIRSSNGCDDDFNDCMFYVKSVTSNAISQARVAPISQPVDTDGDGITDLNDQFPTDATKAYINYYPSQAGYGTLAFEDRWPFLGDYDMNDLVVDYQYAVITNAANNAVEMTARYVLQASGAAFRNGFGVEFPFASALVQSVTGTKVTNNAVVSLGANGCESGQTKAVIIAFDDALTIMNKPAGYINTIVANPINTPDTISMKMTFTRGLTAGELGSAPFNPFIIINKTRGREAHLAGYTPTQKIDTKYYKTGEDNTNPAQNKYFKTKTNLPWGISFVEHFDYPAEGKVMSTAYTKFIPWAQSGGTMNTNWYKDSVNTVRSNLFKH
jgi:LruC domain-containing protein